MIECKTEISFFFAKTSKRKVTIIFQDFCENRLGRVAFAYRWHTLAPPEQPECLDMNEQVYCHEHLINNNLINFTMPGKIGCPGLGEINWDKKDNAKNKTRLYPIKSVAELEMLMNKTMLAVELFVKCPQCETVGSEFLVKNKCKPDDTKPEW